MTLKDVIDKYREENPDITDEEILKALDIEETKPSGLIQKMSSVVDEAIAQRMTDFENTLNEKLEKLIDESEKKFEIAFAETLGLNKNLPVSRDEVKIILRDSLLKMNPEHKGEGKEGDEEEEEDVNKNDSDEWNPEEEFQKLLSRGVM